MSSAPRLMACTVLTALSLAACAAPPLRLYTLAQSPVSADARPLPRRAAVVEVDRLVLPDVLDSDDIVLTDGDVVKRSRTGRWASRLSLLATDLVTSRLAMRAPDTLVTDQWPAREPDYRVMIHIARLDVTSKGRALLDAEWEIHSRNSARRTLRGRVQVELSGPDASDRDIASLDTALFERLADAIELPHGLRSSRQGPAPPRASDAPFPAGKLTMNREPYSSLRTARRRPPCASTMERQIERPTPMPDFFVV